MGRQRTLGSTLARGSWWSDILEVLSPFYRDRTTKPWRASGIGFPLGLSKDFYVETSPKGEDPSPIKAVVLFRSTDPENPVRSS